jgi:protein-S-isoprenylcysteine O-methyltransferase Ste14
MGQADDGTSRSFAARGGWWVLAQIPVMFLAALLPVLTGAGGWAPRSVWASLGALVAAFGVGLSIAGLVRLGEALTPFPAPRAGARLHTDSLYAHVRHPIYAGLIVATLGWALWWLSAWGLAYTALVFLFFDRKAAYEEARLLAVYPGYAHYRRSVAKFVPGLY